MKKILLVFTLGVFLASQEASANWSLGLQGHSGWLINDSATRHYKNPQFGGGAYLYYAPEIFWDFVDLGIRSAYTHFRAKTSSTAQEIDAIDALLSGRLVFLDEPGEDWAIDLHLDIGANYMMPYSSGGKDKLNFAYAIGTQLRYFAFGEHSIGLFVRFHQVLGDVTVASNTKVSNFNSFQGGISIEFSL
ncbi:MAG: hypothetical protein HYW47_08005 [Deltaproteobacteria bacterium]|nr:hypothetical protein [Deltaproteobacteria bacterium]